jgi:5-methylcytosine-specific restriction endonuclease McrA
MAEIIVFYQGPIVTRAEAKARRLKRYFTGKTCLRGHIAQRGVASKGCFQCQKEDRPKYRARYLSTAHGRAVVRRGIAKYMRSAKGRVVARKASARFHKSARGRAATAKREQQPDVKEYRRLATLNRKALKLKSPGSFTSQDYQNLLRRQNKCHICGRRFSKINPPTLDHIIPLSRGGPHDVTNIALACGSCNSAKGPRLTHLL